MVHIRFCFPAGATLTYSIERLSDGQFFDVATSAFDASPAKFMAPLPELAAPHGGCYSANLASTLGQFPDGDYVVYVHDAKTLQVQACLGLVMYQGLDAYVFPPANPTGGTFALSLT